MTRLRRVSPSSPGWTRRRAGKGFVYLDAEGGRLRDPDELQRIRDLVIPPAWTDVWICPYPRGHIQAVGTDARGRRQYLYHPAWRERRDQLKHERVLLVARRLPAARREVEAILAGSTGLTRDRVLACAFRLLDLGFFRVGGEEYAEENGSFGLSTLHREHVRVHAGGRVSYDYVAKSSIPRQVVIDDPATHAVVAALARRMAPEEQLFGWREGRRGWHDLTATDVNGFVHEMLGDATAKDFRTWHATVLAAAHLGAAWAEAERAGRTPMNERAAKRAVSGTMRDVSGYLGNTPAVCRASYVDPKVVDRFREGRTIAPALRGLATIEPPFDASHQARIERAVVRLLSS